MQSIRTGAILLCAVTLAAALAWVLFFTGREEGPSIAEEAGDPAGVESYGEKKSTPGEPVSRPLARLSAAGDSAAFRLRGRVVDRYGEPLAGALVGVDDTLRPVETGADGAFTLRPVRRSFILLVLATGFAPRVEPRTVAPAVPSLDLGELQLLQGGTIRGRVLDRPDRGLPGAEVTLRPLDRPLRTALTAFPTLLVPRTCDGSGRFSFAHVLPGRYRLQAAGPGKLPGRSALVVVTEGRESLVEPIVLAPGYRLSGVVRDGTGAPVAGASLRAGTGSYGRRTTGRGETGQKGRFAVEPLPGEKHWLEVTKTGYLTCIREGLDPLADKELTLRLVPGLGITGTVIDARTRRPVERFGIALRRIGKLDPERNGTVVQQLRRRLDSLRAEAASRTDPAAGRATLKVADELAARLEQLDRARETRPAAAPRHALPVERHPGGRFSLSGLDEGLYLVGIASPDHRYVEAGPITLRGNQEVPPLQVEVQSGPTLSGVVVTGVTGKPVTGARVEAVHVMEAPAEIRRTRRALYPWAFAPPRPLGVTVAAARTGPDGRFSFRHLPPGRMLLTIRHEKYTDHDTEPFLMGTDRRDMRILLRPRALLMGRVTNPGAAGPEGVKVHVLGGQGVMKSVAAAPDGSYRIEGLQPGPYLVRAFPAADRVHINRLFASIFPLHAHAVAGRKIPGRDLELAPGEVKHFDLALDLPPTGTVSGTITVNGLPGRRCRARLRPLPGKASGSGGLSLYAYGDDLGRFTITKVPVGQYTLVLYGPTRRELSRRRVTVRAGEDLSLEADLAGGGLRGRVEPGDGAPAEELLGWLWVLPGAKEVPPDLYTYRHEEQVHRLRVRRGAFAEECLTPGPALLVLDLRGRLPATRRLTIPAGGTLDLVLPAGARRP